MKRDPRTDEEWQLAADAAEFMLRLDSLRQYGLITGGPKADVDRCLLILEGAARRNIFPRKEEGTR